MKRMIRSSDNSFESLGYKVKDTGGGFVAYINDRPVSPECATEDELKELMFNTYENTSTSNNSKNKSSQPERVPQSAQYGRIQSKEVHVPKSAKLYALQSTYNPKYYHGAKGKLVNYKDASMIVYFSKSYAEARARYTKGSYIAIPIEI